MAASNRAAQFTQLHKILKKQKFHVVTPDPERPVLEHLLFAACLEDASYDAAEEAFAALEHNFYDWNEIRVTTIRELSEVMPGLPNPIAAAQRLRGTLQGVFEATYAFDLEGLLKQNLGPAVEQLKKFRRTTTFMVSYVVQAALGGHAIALDEGALTALETVSFITPKNVKTQAIPGLERAISKTKGVEFSCLLHHLSAMFIANPYAPATHKLLLEINPDAKDRLPKRRAKKVKAEAEPAKKKTPESKPTKKKEKVAEEAKDSGDKKKADPAKKPAAPKKKAAEKKTAEAKKKPASPKKAAVKKTPEKKAAKKNAPATKTKPAGKIGKKKPR